MSSALIGYTGFVGGTLDRQHSFDDRYNSKNSAEMRGKSYDLVVCAGAPGAKWLANQKPEEDLANLQALMDNLKEVRAERFVLLSTVDVYEIPVVEVDEATPIDPEKVQPYGRHRYYLEDFVRGQFAQHYVVRLPGLFGEGLRKNFLYDLLNNNVLDMTHKDSVFQFYNMARLWDQIQVVMERGLSLVNFATEPVRSGEVAQECFGVPFENVTERPPVRYDMQTRFAEPFGGTPPYQSSAAQVKADIRAFASAERATAGASKV